MEMMELTIPSNPKELIRTSIGTIKDWLNREKVRIEKNIDRTAIIVKRGTKISLWVNRVAEADKSLNLSDTKFEDLVKRRGENEIM